MAIHDTTHQTKEINKLINDEMGKPYSFIERIKMRGTGSSRMIVECFSNDLDYLNNKLSDTQYANIELRPRGIIVRINKSYNTFAWTIPFYYLSIFNDKFLTIHSQGSFVKFKKVSWKHNKKFIQKIIQLKGEFSA